MSRLIRYIFVGAALSLPAVSSAMAQQSQSGGNTMNGQQGYLNQQQYEPGQGYVRGPTEPVRPVIPEEFRGSQSPDWAATQDKMAVAGREAEAYANPENGRPIEPGVGMSRSPDIANVYMNLQQMPPVLAELRNELARRAQTGQDVRNTNLMRYADQVLNDTRLRILALERSEAIPENSQDIRDAYEQLIYAKRMVAQDQPRLAAGAVNDLMASVIDLTQEAQQAMQYMNNGWNGGRNGD